MVTCVDAIREVIREPGKIYSTKEVIDLIYQKYPERPWKESTIRCHLIGLSVNHPSCIHYPTLRRQAFLFSLGGGRWRLYDPEKDGEWVWDRTGVRLVGEESEGEEVRGEASISLESDLEDYIIKNLDQIEEGLTLYSEGGKLGRQYATDVGRIDVLARDRNGDFVVIELKAGTAKHGVIGQILSYMNWVRRNLASGRKVRGIIIAEDFDDKLKYAVREIPNVTLKKYVVKFEFHDESVS